MKKISTLTGIIIILAVAVIMFGGAFAYEYRGTKNGLKIENPQIISEAVNWKTYTNSDYGFSLQYPPSLSYLAHQHTQQELSTEITDGDPGHTVFDFLLTKNPNAEFVNSGISLGIQKVENTKWIHYNNSNTFYSIEKNGYVYSLSVFGSDPVYTSIFQQVASTFTLTNTINYTTYLPGKIFLDDSLSGQVGIFHADHTLSMARGLDYVPNDTRPHNGTGQWAVSGNTLIITSPSSFGGYQEKYDLSSMQQQVIGQSIVLGNWENVADAGSSPDNAGFFIGDNLNTLSKITDVSVFSDLLKFLPTN